MIRDSARNFASPCKCERLMTSRDEIAQRGKVNLVAARDRFEHEGKGGVLVHYHGRERIHHEQISMRHD
jgi:hypothetical protein